MNSKPVFPYGALRARISSALYHLGKFDPRDTNRWRLHGDLVGSVVQGKETTSFRSPPADFHISLNVRFGS